jgi:hypothetical protein
MDMRLQYCGDRAFFRLCDRRGLISKQEAVNAPAACLLAIVIPSLAKAVRIVKPDCTIP